MQILLSLLLLVPTIAHAQTRSTSGGARLELAFDHGYGGGSEGGYAELALDLRVWAPTGGGLVLRTGLASNGFSNAIAVDLGYGVRADLARGTRGGVQLFFAAGAAYAYGPFEGWAHALGTFATLGIDLWHRNFFTGLGATAHVLGTETGDNGLRPIWTIAPMLRIGGDWGL